MQLEEFLIVGSGVFGASTTLWLIRNVQGCRVILVEKDDIPSQSAASTDLNRIIRTEYEDLTHMRLALKAQQAWRDDSFYSSYFHSAEMVMLDKTDSPRKIIEMFRALGVEPNARMISKCEIKHRHRGLLDEMAFYEADEAYVNPDSGWVEASNALKHVLRAATEAGVEFKRATVTKLLFNKEGDCTGVKCIDGEIITATHIVLAAGVNSIELLADSALERSDFRVENRILGAAVVKCVAKLREEQHRRFDALPISVHDVGDIFGEVLPPTADGYLKFASETSFKNTVYHEASGQTISIPAQTAKIPRSLQDECWRICRDILGTYGEDLELESFKICWDCYTADGDFIISPHPTCEGLYFAIGGSFHSWKFLPILGEMVGKMINGSLEEDLIRRWAWDRAMPEGCHGGLWPNREWHDLKNSESSSHVM